MFIDSHCHLDMEPLKNEMPVVIERAYKAGVEKMINIGTSFSRSRQSVEIANFYPNVWASVGLHPQDIGEVVDVDEAISRLEEIASDGRVVAIGEIGLDYYSAGTVTKGTVLNEEKERQRELLVAQIELAERMNLPVIFHVRDAWDDFFEIIKKHKCKGAVHCFTGDKKIADKVVEAGLYVGFTGFVTFEQEKLDPIREAVKAVPLDKILIETDAPFLAPEPYRGKTNEPAYVVEVAKKIAELKGVSVEEVAEKTLHNAKKVFSLA